MAEYIELTINQGATFKKSRTLKNADQTPIDLTGYTFVSQIRKSFYSMNPTANITVTTTDTANGIIELSMVAADTANVKAGRYVYDLKMTTDAGIVIREMEGVVTVTPQVSK